MPLPKIKHVAGRAVCVPGDDIDTDRIIPARFMKCVTFDGLGQYAFYDVRFDPDSGKPLNHPLDRLEHKNAAILISGNNFGCGSSREHAPQALQKFGIRAVVAGSFAEIFFGNCTTLGIPCVSVADADREKLVQQLSANPAADACVDLEALKVRVGECSVPCTIKEGARKALLEGQWDAIGLLLEGAAQAGQLEAELHYLVKRA
ncbi:MAG: 3-isopropylmalate dehydratase small subunit [Planctomycetota bacterium]|nr:3-isopropylmalate dehydratase small subunit [Planctomycetota bacterium]